MGQIDTLTKIIAHYNQVYPFIVQIKVITDQKSKFKQLGCCSNSLLVFNPIHFNLIVNQLIDIGDDGGALDVHKDEAGGDVGVQGGVGPGGGTRVHIKLVLVLVSFKLVGVTAYKNVTVQLPVTTKCV